VPTSAVTAVPAIGKERRGEHAEPGHRILVRRLTGSDGAEVALDDLDEPRMPRRQSPWVGALEVFHAQVRHDLHGIRSVSLKGRIA
jgi:hypothetical protein